MKAKVCFMSQQLAGFLFKLYYATHIKTRERNTDISFKL